MLKLSRKEGETLVLTQHDTTVVIRIESIKGSRVKISINAPSDVRVMRGELLTITGETK
jgi:carbon storage regulator CsrA